MIPDAIFRTTIDKPIHRCAEVTEQTPGTRTEAVIKRLANN